MCITWQIQEIYNMNMRKNINIKYCPFIVARYFSDVDDDVGVVYVGPEYAKPN